MPYDEARPFFMRTCCSRTLSKRRRAVGGGVPGPDARAAAQLLRRARAVRAGGRSAGRIGVDEARLADPQILGPLPTGNRITAQGAKVPDAVGRFRAAQRHDGRPGPPPRRRTTHHQTTAALVRRVRGPCGTRVCRTGVRKRKRWRATGSCRASASDHPPMLYRRVRV